MATAVGRSRCATCDHENAKLKCGGCTQDFGYKHFVDHREGLNIQLEEVEVNRDLFRQTLSEKTAEPEKHLLIKQIDQWECDSIEKIRQAAQEARQMLLQNTTTTDIKHIEVKLNELTDQIRQGREEQDFVETDLRHWNEQLTELTKELNKPSNISLRHDSKPFVTKLYVEIATGSMHILNIDANAKWIQNGVTVAKWIQNGVTVAGGNGNGSKLNQLSNPVGMYVDDNQTIYIAEPTHRIVEWKRDAKSGRVVAGGKGNGNRSDQLNESVDVILHKEMNSLIICDSRNRRVVRWPLQNGASGQIIVSDIDCCRLTIDHDGYLYVSDGKNHQVRRWRIGDTTGTVVAGGNGKGNRLNQLNDPSFIFVDKDQSVYVSDWGNNRVMKWKKGSSEGIVVAGGHGKGNGLSQLSGPQGVIVDQLGTVYVADYTNSRVMRWYNGAMKGTIVVGGNGEGERPNQLNYPQGLSFDRQGNLYVVDQFNNRVQKFNIDSASSFQ